MEVYLASEKRAIKRSSQGGFEVKAVVIKKYSSN